MNIYAETVIIRSPLKLPQTDVMIYAKELRFEDVAGSATAQIDTTPLANSLIPSMFNNGVAGLKAGKIIVNIGVFSNSGSTPRFVLRGGNGQPAGEGRNGSDGTNSGTMGGLWACPWPNNTVKATAYWSDNEI